MAEKKLPHTQAIQVESHCHYWSVCIQTRFIVFFFYTNIKLWTHFKVDSIFFCAIFYHNSLLIWHAALQSDTVLNSNDLFNIQKDEFLTEFLRICFFFPIKLMRIPFLHRFSPTNCEWHSHESRWISCCLLVSS